MVKKRIALVSFFAVLWYLALIAQRPGPEAFEIGTHNAAEMPKGKEADGIVGDFVLRNDQIELLVGGNLPLRRANMTTLYEAPIPGTIFDLDLRGAENDQITAFRPGHEMSMMSYVRVAENLPAGVAGLEAVRTAATGAGLYTRHLYTLENGWRHVEITSTYHNEGGSPRKITPLAQWKGLDQEAQAGEVRTGDSIDPFDKRGYAWAPLEPRTVAEEVTLQPGEEKTYKIALAAANSPLEAYGVVAALLGTTGEVHGSVADQEGEPAQRAEILAEIDGATLKAYPNEAGDYRFRLPGGSYELRIFDLGRDSFEQSVTVASGKQVSLDWKVSNASMVAGIIRDSSGQPSPGKVQFLGRNGTPDPNFGTEYRAHGNSHQYQTHDGRFAQQIPPGDYLVRITHGPEFNLYEQEITVGKGEKIEVAATLEQSVDTTGWVSTDFHSHSTVSGDNYCNTHDRIINLAAEHIEFAPTTEHNRIYDWKALIDRLGLSGRIKTVPGIELTGSGQHFNSFPLSPDPNVQNGGAPVWNYDPRINAIVLRNWGTPSLAGGSRFDTGVNPRVAKDSLFAGGPSRWVQANHPNVANVFFDRDADGVRDGGFTGFEKLVDAAEVWSTEILNLNPVYRDESGDREIPNRTFQWLQMLNQGRHVWCVAVSDAHRIFGNGVGNWRTYVPSSTDDPADIDHAEIVRNAKAGRMMITNGPYLEVETADGSPIGSSLRTPGYVELKIRVQAPDWMEVDRVQVLVNARQPEEYNFTAAKNSDMFREGTVRFEQTIRVNLQEDAHLIVVATDEDSDLTRGWGLNPQGKMRPVAYTNPIYVDVDGDGFRANGDTLGHPLPASSQSD